VMRLLKFGAIAVACAAIAVLSSLALFLCSTWLLMSTPVAQSMALGALSMCGSGFIALMEVSRPFSAARSRARTEATESTLDR
jgi:hypothetical protein